MPCVGAYYSFNICIPHGTFLSFLKIDKTAGAYSLQIYDYLSQIQSEIWCTPGIDTRSVLSENGLKMNPNNTECIIFATPNFNKRTETFQLTIDSMVKHMEDKVKSRE